MTDNDMPKPDCATIVCDPADNSFVVICSHCATRLLRSGKADLATQNLRPEGRDLIPRFNVMTMRPGHSYLSTAKELGGLH